MEEQTHKAHRPSQSGSRADKKKGKSKERQQGNNEKVFQYALCHKFLKHAEY